MRHKPYPTFPNILHSTNMVCVILINVLSVFVSKCDKGHSSKFSMLQCCISHVSDLCYRNDDASLLSIVLLTTI